MPQLVALSLSIAVLGGIWAFVALKLGFLVWAGFIAWGCYFHSGGDQKALIKTICGNVYGIIVAWIALLIIFKAGVADMGLIPIAIVVAVTVFFLVIVASIDQLSAVPANVYGYAATVAFSLTGHTFAPAALPDAPATDPIAYLTAPSLANPLVALIVAMVIGAIAGYVSGLAANAIGKKATA
jgi:hypothetical protein